MDVGTAVASTNLASTGGAVEEEVGGGGERMSGGSSTRAVACPWQPARTGEREREGRQGAKNAEIVFHDCFSPLWRLATGRQSPYRRTSARSGMSASNTGSFAPGCSVEAMKTSAAL